MAYKTLQEAYADINSKIIDNTERLITEPIMRNLLHDLTEYLARPDITHTTDANFQVLAEQRLIVCDPITTDRTISFPANPTGGQRVELFVIMTVNFNWQTDLEFHDGGGLRRLLSSGSQRFCYDGTMSRWLLVGGL